MRQWKRLAFFFLLHEENWMVSIIIYEMKMIHGILRVNAWPKKIFRFSKHLKSLIKLNSFGCTNETNQKNVDESIQLTCIEYVIYLLFDAISVSMHRRPRKNMEMVVIECSQTHILRGSVDCWYVKVENVIMFISW